MKTLLTVAMLAATAFGMVTAYWTGVSERTETYDKRVATRCQYKLPNGNLTYRTFVGFSCPQSITVE